MSRQSSCRQASKEDLLGEMGGESQFEFVIMTFCESIQEDSELRDVFKGMHVDTLVDLMKNLLNAALDLLSSHCESTRSFVVMKNYALLELGLSKSHFDKMKTHYEAALHDAWVHDEVFAECLQRFGYLETIFQEEGKDFEKAVVANKKVAARIMNARCA